MIRIPALSAMFGLAFCAAAGAQGLAPSPPRESAQDAIGEALGLFHRVCIAALVRREPAEAIAAAAFPEAWRVPADRLRRTEQIRETAAWRVPSHLARHSVILMEPGTQCGVFTEGVVPDTFLFHARRTMTDAARFPGWQLRGDLRESVQQRPYGTLTYVFAEYAGTGPQQGEAHVTASAANRTDGRPNTAIITTALGLRR